MCPSFSNALYMRHAADATHTVGLGVGSGKTFAVEHMLHFMLEVLLGTLQTYFMGL